MKGRLLGQEKGPETFSWGKEHPLPVKGRGERGELRPELRANRPLF